MGGRPPTHVVAALLLVALGVGIGVNWAPRHHAGLRIRSGDARCGRQVDAPVRRRRFAAQTIALPVVAPEWSVPLPLFAGLDAQLAVTISTLMAALAAVAYVAVIVALTGWRPIARPR